MRKGYLIILEGPDGTGKTTQARILADKLTIDGYSCITTEQPGGSREGRIIRDMLLNPDLRISAKMELFLFLADRADNVAKIIMPALEKDKIVISSRYFYSTLVYQGLVREVAPYDFLFQMNLFAVNNVIPDIVYYIDIAPEDGLTKAMHSTQEKLKYPAGDRIEQEGIFFQQKVREGYMNIASRFKDLFVTIDGRGRSKKEIGDIIYADVKGRFFHD